MNPMVEAAWIAGASGLVGVIVGVGGTVTVGVIGFRSTRAATEKTNATSTDATKATIEADRRSRIWEKQAGAYTDAVAMIMRRQDIRQGMWLGVRTGNEPARPPALVEPKQVEAQVIAYGSTTIMKALRAAGEAGMAYESAIGRWHAESQQVRDLAGSGIAPTMPRSQTVEDMEKKLHEANRLDDKVIDAISAELHAITSAAPELPVPMAPD